jgi:hypothetical protein
MTIVQYLRALSRHLELRSIMSHNFFVLNDLQAQENANEIRGSAIFTNAPSNVTIRSGVHTENLSDSCCNGSSHPTSKRTLAMCSHFASQSNVIEMPLKESLLEVRTRHRKFSVPCSDSVLCELPEMSASIFECDRSIRPLNVLFTLAALSHS